jgi:hypoxanthine phosphoribosyltransferase
MIDRMFFQPEFTGKVIPGKYILVDDVFTTGITLKSLKTFIENCDGNVVSAYTLGSCKSTLFEASRLQLRILNGRYPEVDLFMQSFP